MHKIGIIITTFLLVAVAIISYHFGRTHSHEIISLFPLQNYDQTISDWISPASSDYHTPLLTPTQQKAHQLEFFNHYIGTQSPWSPTYLQQFYSEISGQTLRLNQQQRINYYGNSQKVCTKIGYGSNFRPYPPEWITHLEKKINLKQFNSPQTYLPSRRVIAINNIMGRNLPTDEVHFFDHKLAGQGYPFDNLQASIIWAGTPLYVLGETEDHTWSLVLSPGFIAWVKNNDIAKVDDTFIETWQHQAEQSLIAITKTDIPITDTEDNLARFPAYIGMALPGNFANNQFQILIPIRDEKGNAHIHHAKLDASQATLMPLLPTPQNFAVIINQLIGRPYGWGGMYFYNDCVTELKNLFTPFGIVLPSHTKNASKEQGLIKINDASKLKLDDRINYLMKQGHKFMTVVNIGTHVFLYLGNYPNPMDYKHTVVALSYQNSWGLKPKYAYFQNDRRAVIGKAILLPILKSYPEDPNLESLADKEQFELIYLDEATSPNVNTDFQLLFSQ